jgi:phosphotransferase system enzyme I (PtsP)
VLLGAMIEVPSLLYELDTLMPRVDFVSVGSNDLLQYLYAADRNNTRVSGRYDPLSAASLRALAAIAEAAGRHNKPLSLCGEMAGRPLEALALIGLGYRSISMSAAAIGPVKAMLTELPHAQLKSFLDDALSRPARGRDMRRELQSFAEAHGVPL